MFAFMKKQSKDPMKGLDRAWRNCQEKLLDILCPLTKTLERAFQAKYSSAPTIPNVLCSGALSGTGHPGAGVGPAGEPCLIGPSVEPGPHVVGAGCRAGPPAPARRREARTAGPGPFCGGGRSSLRRRAWRHTPGRGGNGPGDGVGGTQQRCAALAPRP
ncbi:hypothetical protein NDU88_001601 [Pleurodeles waltl]|uniref:Uncharacterized protein n=1 Tax=Pleurodeles waltl TaxID=8319 RepID=A0AAV7RDH9_PLEWA|nr:hypothetical protein NDU88_001601 [Pleurodeles waltl]